MPTMAARYEGWLTVVADPLERYLLWLQGAFRSAGVPYPQGASIIALTACVKLATFPFTKKQVESGLSMQNLNPQIKALRERWAGDENSAKLNSELSALYKRYGVNPLAGCIPTLTTLPVFWGLYRALLNGSADGAFKEPFWFVPSLAGPTYVPFAGNTGGLSWLWPLNADGVPPIGWDQAQAYLILPVALVVSQYIATVLVPPTPPDEDAKEDDNAKTTKAVLKLLPLMVGYFSLTLPAGMGLYWLANNVFTTATTYYLKNLGGAQTPVPKLERPKLKLGTAIRSGGGAEEGEAMAADMMAAVSAPPVAADVAQPAVAASVSAAPVVATEVEAPVAAAASAPVPAPAAAAAQPAPAAAEAAAAVLAARMPRRCKRAKDPAKRKPATGRPPLAA
jgi:YidC/Oxa1 family membrane protein insertase